METVMITAGAVRVGDVLNYGGFTHRVIKITSERSLLRDWENVYAIHFEWPCTCFATLPERMEVELVMNASL